MKKVEAYWMTKDYKWHSKEKEMTQEELDELVAWVEQSIEIGTIIDYRVVAFEEI